MPKTHSYKAVYPLARSNDGQLDSDVLPVLEKEGGVKAWTQGGNDPHGELFILFADSLSEREKAALRAASDVVLTDPDDLTTKPADLEKENRHLRSLSLTDELTGLYNYRFFARQLDIEMARTMRTGQACALIMIDLDDFKQINDTFGHDRGNTFLVQVSQALARKLRPTDIMCRYGGDEFAVIMPATDLSDAVRIAERLNAAVSTLSPELEKHFSVSIGVAEYEPERSGELDMNQFIRSADKALYRAKERGKDGICYEGRLPNVDTMTSVSSDEKTALLGSRNDE